MEKLVDFFYKIDKWFKKFKFFEALKRAFTMMIPVFIIGAFSLVMMYFPVETIRDAIKDTFLYKIFEIIHYSTYGVAVIYLVFGFTFRYSESFEENNTLRLFYILNSLIVYFIFLGPTVLMNKDPNAHVIDYLSVKNIFPALIVCTTATIMFKYIYNFMTKNKKIPNHTFDVGVYALIPMVICISIFSIVAVLLDKISFINNFNDAIVKIIAYPFKHLGNSYGNGALITTVESILWFFGIHGGNVLEVAKTQEVFAIREGAIISKTFLDTFVLMGGCGTILSFAIAVLIATKKQKSKRITYMSMGPMVFNINEITVFGIPIVLNPIFLIPFILVPFASFTIAYASVSAGIVPHVSNEVYWTTPVFISGYRATGSITGSLLQAVILAVGVLIYIPFVKLDNYVTIKSTDSMIEQLSEYVKQCESKSEKTHIFDLDAQLSRIAESIADKLEKDIDDNKIEMYYQPLYKGGHVHSLESLLRFKYNDNFLYPPLVISIAIEKGIFDKLSKCIINCVLTDLKKFTSVNKKIRASVNLRYSLLSDESFIEWLFESVTKFDIPAGALGIEVTEETSLPTDVDMDRIFNSIRAKKIKMYLDDFSMGKTSIKYLQNNHFDYVKLDGELVKNINNDRCCDIVTSILKLGNDLEFEVIAEYVESKEIYDKLKELGCLIYQGYYYSKPINKNGIMILLKEDLE